MTDADFDRIAKLLHHAAGHSEDGENACKERNVEALGSSLLWAHETICDACNDFARMYGKIKNESRND